MQDNYIAVEVFFFKNIPAISGTECWSGSVGYDAFTFELKKTPIYGISVFGNPPVATDRTRKSRYTQDVMLRHCIV